MGKVKRAELERWLSWQSACSGGLWTWIGSTRPSQKRWVWRCTHVIPTLERQRQKNPQDSLASQFSLISDLQVQWKTLFHKGGVWLRKTTMSISGLHMSVCIHTHMRVRVRAHTHTEAKENVKLFASVKTMQSTSFAETEKHGPKNSKRGWWW